MQRLNCALRAPSPPRAQEVSHRLSALDAWAFVLPAVSFVEIAIVGQLIVTEILMLAMLPWLWGIRDRPALPRWFVVLWAGWLLSQIMTDVVIGSAFADYTRGWSAIVFTFTDFAAILVLVSTPRRARLFALGLAAGGALGYVFVPNAYASGDPWKWAFALPIGLLLAAGLSGTTGARFRWLSVGTFVAFGIVNLALGFRSLGGVSLLTAGYLVLSVVAGHPERASTASMFRAVAGLCFLAVAVWGTLQVYDAAASQGLLGADAQAKYLNQSGSLGVLIGGRSEVLVSSQAIIDSPILGHGSWARDPAYAELLNERLSSLGYEIGATSSDVVLIPAHSYLLQSWVWAGLLGGVFWFSILGIAAWLLGNLYSFRVDLAPLIVFSTMLLLWNIAFSPYGSSQRLLACFGIALCLLGLRLVRGDEIDDAPAHLSSSASRYAQPRSGVQQADGGPRGTFGGPTTSQTSAASLATLLPPRRPRPDHSASAVASSWLPTRPRSVRWGSGYSGPRASTQIACIPRLGRRDSWRPALAARPRNVQPLPMSRRRGLNRAGQA